MDVDKDGFLARKDFTALTERWVYRGADRERVTPIMMGWWKILLAASDLNRDNKVTLDEVLSVVDQLPRMLGAVTKTADAMFEAIDENGDGRIDAVVTALGEPAELWENVSPAAGHWIAVHLIGEKSNRDGIGARVRIGSQTAEMTTAVGYASSASIPLHFGLGPAAAAPKIEIRWPDGTSQTVLAGPADRVVEVRQK
jgi:hypothetical protein